MSHAIIALWSHPRSMSTAFERIMRTRGDLDCLHEPFMYDYYVNRAKKQMPHFDAMDAHPKTYESIRAMILAKAESGPVFFKDMAYYVVPHILQDEDFLRRITHSFLIRDPKASLVSYAKLDPDFTSEELGLEAQWQLWEGIAARTGQKALVIESERVQAEPTGQMRGYWSAVGLADKPEALQWDGAVPQDWQQVKGWHQAAMSSSTVMPMTDEKARKIEQDFANLVATEPRHQAIYDRHMPAYDALRSAAQH